MRQQMRIEKRRSSKYFNDSIKKFAQIQEAEEGESRLNHLALKSEEEKNQSLLIDKIKSEPVEDKVATIKFRKSGIVKNPMKASIF